MNKNDMYIVKRWETVSITELIQIHDPNDNPEDAFYQGAYTSVKVLGDEIVDFGWTDIDEAVAVERMRYVWEFVWEEKAKEDNQ